MKSIFGTLEGLKTAILTYLTLRKLQNWQFLKFEVKLESTELISRKI